MTERIKKTFKNLKGNTAFVAYIMGGDPDRASSQAVFIALPENGWILSRGRTDD